MKMQRRTDANTQISTVSVDLRASRRIQDADDAPVLGAAQDGNALTWDNANGVFSADGLTASAINSGAAIAGMLLAADGAGGAAWEAVSAPAAASATVAGIVELATTTEAATGTDTVRAVTPEGLPLRKIGDGWALGSGGNSRGLGAVDLQTVRIDPMQVASSNYATVGGGRNNTASAVNSTVGGGYGNIASGPRATVGGGQNNTASGDYSAVSGGYGNTVSGGSAAVGGGQDNIASRHHSTVGGGLSNTASGYYSTVGGGLTNTASGHYSAVSGGYGNTASGSSAAVGGGRNNTASAVNSTVGGGYVNIASGPRATVGGGQNNTASGTFATIGGGQGNTASGTKAALGGGYNNIVGGDYATVGGGNFNIANGNFTTIGGGQGAKTNKYGQNAFASGTFVSAGDAQTSVLVARAATTTATPTPLFLDGASEKLTIAADTTWAFTAVVVARRTDADNESAAYRFEGCIDNNAGTTALVGTVAKVVIAEDSAGWDCDVTADNTNDALIITATGEAGKTIRWVARIELVEVTG